MAIAPGTLDRTVQVMYILIEPEQFTAELESLAHLAVAVVSSASGLSVGKSGQIDGLVDQVDRPVVEAVNHLLNVVYSGDRVPAELKEFLRAVADRLP